MYGSIPCSECDHLPASKLEYEKMVECFGYRYHLTCLRKVLNKNVGTEQAVVVLTQLMAKPVVSSVKTRERSVIHVQTS